MKFIADNEVNNYKKALAIECPIHAMIGRVLVIQIRPEHKVEQAENGIPVIKEGKLWLPEHAVAATEREGGIMSKNEVVKAVVKSVGFTSIREKLDLHQTEKALEVNDIVYVFPGVFETIIQLEGVDYMSYSMRDIVARLRGTYVPDIYDNKEMD